MDQKDLKARAEAAFGQPMTSVEGTSPAASNLEQDAVTAHEKIERLRALREAREKVEAERAENARLRARRARTVHKS